MVSIAVSGVRALKKKELRRLAEDLQRLWEHSGGRGPESLSPLNRALYEEIRRVWLERGVQLELF